MPACRTVSFTQWALESIRKRISRKSRAEGLHWSSSADLITSCFLTRNSPLWAASSSRAIRATLESFELPVCAESAKRHPTCTTAVFRPSRTLLIGNSITGVWFLVRPSVSHWMSARTFCVSCEHYESLLLVSSSSDPRLARTQGSRFHGSPLAWEGITSCVQVPRISFSWLHPRRVLGELDFRLSWYQ